MKYVRNIQPIRNLLIWYDNSLVQTYLAAQPTLLYVFVGCVVAYCIALAVTTRRQSKREFYPVRRVWGVLAEPTKLISVSFGLLPPVILVIAYLGVSNYRLSKNPADKLTPSFGRMVVAFDTYMTKPFKKPGLMQAEYAEVKERYQTLLATENEALEKIHTSTLLHKPQAALQYLSAITHRHIYGIPYSNFQNDTRSSLSRIWKGVALAALTGLIFGLNIGLFPAARVMFLPTIRFLSIIPPLAILAILLSLFGIYETGKIMLIYVGTTFFIIRDMRNQAEDIPKESIVKLFTLGASDIQIVYGSILRRMLPMLLNSVRLSLGGAWLFLLASEGIAAESGLGFRIFQAGRFMLMEQVVPLVLYITLLGYLFDMLLTKANRVFFPWTRNKKG